MPRRGIAIVASASAACVPRSYSTTPELHARGPFALDALTSYKYVLRGSGQVRA